jgi:voltage-gated sodium channel
MVAGLGSEHPSWTGWQEKRAALRAFFASPRWERTIVTLIVINAIVLGLETSPTVMSFAGGAIRLIDNIILAIFVVEITLRILAYGRAFWRDGWSLFDFFVVAIALIPATGGFAVLRALRIIRVLRLISTIKSMRRVMGGMLAAIPSMGAVIALLALIYYVSAVIATKLYGEDYPDNFGTLGDSLFSLFQIMTLEGWADNFVIPVMQKHPYAWIFFIIFMLVTSFTVLNLFIGIIVDAMQSEQESELSQDRVRSEANFDTIMTELHALRNEVSALRRERGPPGEG